MTPALGYVVATTPRTGSTLLCRAVSLTGVLGHPREHFAPKTVEALSARFRLPSDPTTWGPYLDLALLQGATPNGVFATKLFPRHVELLAGRGGGVPWPALLAEDLRAVHLTRRPIDSAVSWWRATHTGEWHRSPGADPVAMPPLDVEVIDQRHDWYHAKQRWWPEELDRVGLEPLEVTYDDLVADLPRVVEAIAEHVGVTLDGPARVPADTVRQADDETVVAISAWAAATGGCERCGA
jgi:LPS sulfotransferase NodH